MPLYAQWVDSPYKAENGIAAKTNPSPHKERVDAHVKGAIAHQVSRGIRRYHSIACKVLLSLSLLSLGANPFVAGQAFAGDSSLAKNNKLKLALVFAGGGLKWPLYYGVHDGVRRRGYDPNLLIGACGGSLAAATLHIMGPSFDRLQANRKLTEEVFQIVSLTKPAQKGVVPMLIAARKAMTSERRGVFPKVFFKKYLYHFPKEVMSAQFKVPFEPNADGQHLAILSARLLSPQEQSERSLVLGRKIFLRQVIFTDVEMASRWQGFQSTLPTRFPHSHVDSEVEIRSDFRIDEAVRASVSDPLLVEPFEKNGQYFFSGAVDNIPDDLGLHVARRLILPIETHDLPTYQDKIFGALYGHNMRDAYRAHQSSQQLLDIDVSFKENETLQSSPNPTVHWLLWFKQHFPKTIYDAEEFLNESYRFGRRRALFALNPSVVTISVSDSIITTEGEH